jgi:flagellar biogenesis protein FliO
MRSGKAVRQKSISRSLWCAASAAFLVLASSAFSQAFRPPANDARQAEKPAQASNQRYLAADSSLLHESGRGKNDEEALTQSSRGSGVASCDMDLATVESSPQENIDEEGSDEKPGEAADTKPSAQAGEEGSSSGSSIALSKDDAGDPLPDLKGSFVKMILSIGLVLLLALAVRSLFKRSGQKRSNNSKGTNIDVKGFVSLGNGVGIHEVQIGKRVLFIGEGAKGLQLLRELDATELEQYQCMDPDEEGAFCEMLRENDPLSSTKKGNATSAKGWLDALRWKTAGWH